MRVRVCYGTRGRREDSRGARSEVAVLSPHFNSLMHKLIPQDELLRVQDGMGVKGKSPFACERGETHRIHVVAPESILHCRSVTGDATPTTILKKKKSQSVPKFVAYLFRL